MQVVLTRDGTNVTAYVNGAQQFTFVDSGNNAVLTTAATTGLDRALRGLLQPASVRRRSLRPGLDIVGSAVVDPAPMMRRALAEDHHEPFAGRHQALGSADHGVVGVDQDHRLREWWPQPGYQASAGVVVVVAVRDQ